MAAQRIPKPFKGKGRKKPCLLLWKETAADLRAWLTVRGDVHVLELIVNAEGAAMTPAGFEYVLDKHTLHGRRNTRPFAGTP